MTNYITKNWTSKSIKKFIALNGGGDPREIIQRKITSLLEKTTINSLPINPTRIINYVGIKKIIYTRKAISGALIANPNGHIVYINANYSARKRNFVCAHEIGHTFFLVQNSPVNKYDKTVGFHHIDNEEEYLCDFCAAEILMPEKYFYPKILGCKPNINLIKKLSLEFNTSIAATGIRLINTNIHKNIIIIYWKSYPRPGSEKKLRVLWSATPSKLRKYIPKFATPNTKSEVILEAYESNQIMSGIEKYKLGNLKGEYFTEALPLYEGDERGVFSLVTLNN